MATNGSRVEARLRRYRPAPPPEALRERCLAWSEARVWPWAVAAAVLLAAAIGFRAQAGSAMAAAGARMGPDPAAREAIELAETLGGGDDAREFAALIVATARAQEAGAPVAGEIQGDAR